MPLICPRCGEEGSMIMKNVNGRSYIYFKHYEEKNKYSYCYVGPADHYIAVNKVYGDRALRLVNVMMVDWLEYVIKSIENAVKDVEEANEKTRERAIKNVLDGLNVIEKKIEEAKQRIQRLMQSVGNFTH